MKRRDLMLKAVQRGKYTELYAHLSNLSGEEWKTTFATLETIIGFSLPDSAYLYRPWWANQSKSGHSQSMAWSVAGWKTSDVDMENETLTFRRDGPSPVATNLKNSDRVMFVLKDHPDSDDDEIAELIDVRRETVNQECRLLAERGLISREVGSSGKIVNRLIDRTAGGQ